MGSRDFRIEGDGDATSDLDKTGRPSMLRLSADGQSEGLNRALQRLHIGSRLRSASAHLLGFGRLVYCQQQARRFGSRIPKAFLLAEDRQIEDPTILFQIGA